MKRSDYPRVLIISRGVWDDSQGTSSTLTNFFEDYDPDKLAHIYIETKMPHTSCCYRFFQISEISLVRKLWHWNLKTGHAFDTRREDTICVSDKDAEKEAETMSYVRRHRSLLFSSLREVLWRMNGWKSNELKQFIDDFNPNVIWVDGSPLPLMNRLSSYILQISKKPASIFLQDDIYTFESISGGLFSRWRRLNLRRIVRKVVSRCSNVFVASPKMKREIDEFFGVDSVFIAKSFRMVDSTFSPSCPHQPLRLVYMGQVLYGRIKTLIDIAEAMKEINKNEEKLQLSIYTNNNVDDVDSLHLLAGGSVFLKEPVAYSMVPDVIAENDVVVFVETFNSKMNKIARLSFSTKISDYLRSGKCIMAVGPSDLAPIEYFIEEDAAIVATSPEEIGGCLESLFSQGLVEEYAVKANNCAKKNHERTKMNKTIYGRLVDISD